MYFQKATNIVETWLWCDELVGLSSDRCVTVHSSVC